MIDPKDAPVRSITTVLEDGASRTFAQGYSTAQVIIRNLGLDDAPCYLVRMDNHQQTAWSPGLQNIAVTYDCGPATNAAVHPVAIHAAKELSWLVFKEGRRTGVLTATKGGSASQYLKDLGEATLRALKALQRWQP